MVLDRTRLCCIAMLGLLAAASPVPADDSIPHLHKQGTATQLVVHGKPMVLLAGELHNSSASSLQYMKAVWPRIKAVNLNTVLATISWELVEQEEGKFDFSLIDGLIRQARENDLKLVFLWFGSWKNGVSSYAPAWVKRDLRRFPRALGSSNRNIKDVLSTLGEQTMLADAKAFAAVMKHLKEIDGKQNTVIMMQVENEVGIKPEPRDLSPQADLAFNSAVPAALLEYLSKNKDKLIPELKATWEKAGGKTAGAWPEVFGATDAAAEIFSAWHYAIYINTIVKAGKTEYPLPMFVNAWLRSPGAKLSTYPSGGPVSHVMDIWRAAAPDIDFYAPDIYLADFKGVCADYTQLGNPLLIPEAQTDEAAVARAFWAVAQHDAIGFSPFGIEQITDAHPLAAGYAVLRQLMPLITRAQGTGQMIGLYQQERGDDKPTPGRVGDYRANVKFIARDMPRGVPPFGLIIQAGPDELFIAGLGIEVMNLSSIAPGPKQQAILSVEMGHFDTHGAWVTDMRLNGDETGANYAARIPPNARNPLLEPAKPRILKVRTYRYE